MPYRHRARKPSIALWMVVAVGDLALLVASVGMVALIALASVVTVAAVTVGGWLLVRRGVPNREMMPARMAVPGATQSRTGTASQLR